MSENAPNPIIADLKRQAIGPQRGYNYQSSVRRRSMSDHLRWRVGISNSPRQQSDFLRVTDTRLNTALAANGYFRFEKRLSGPATQPEPHRGDQLIAWAKVPAALSQARRPR
jgi:hypothetical protein